VLPGRPAGLTACWDSSGEWTTAERPAVVRWFALALPGGRDLALFLFQGEILQVAAQTPCNPPNGFEVFRRQGIDEEPADQPEVRR
jgi:hypothetical protein